MLHLTLKKHWYDMIESGNKKEEYRDLKPYWETRLGEDLNGRFHEVVEFRNGYRKDSRRMRFKIDDVTIDVGEEAWGAPPRKVFIIKLGEIIDFI